jgi:hypothetical protein
MRDRWESEKSKKIEAALLQLKKEVMGALEGEPELTRKLLDLIHRASETMMEKTA